MASISASNFTNVSRHFAITVLAFACFAASPAHAMTIHVTYDPSVTGLPNAAQVETAFAAAVQMFQSQYTNSITVNITMYWGAAGPFSGGSLGASSTSLRTYTYAQIRSALSNRRVSATDFSAVASLPASDPTGGSTWYVPRAQAKVLGLSGVGANDSINDGSVDFSSSYSYAFDPNNRAVPSQFDFIGVAEHEISEVLGRIYGLSRNLAGYIPYDLFRFTADATRSFDPNATGVYFSVDNGATALKSFYDNVNAGDVQDWASSATPDAYDAAASAGHLLPVSDVDITTLDVLGYNLSLPAPVAVPSNLTGVRQGNGSFLLSFTNTPGASFTVLATTNISLSLSNWSVLGAATESPAGQFQFTDAQSAAHPGRFYRVRSP
jgi:hypothetical protein